MRFQYVLAEFSSDIRNRIPLFKFTLQKFVIPMENYFLKNNKKLQLLVIE